MKSKKTVKMQALSNGSDVLRMVGKYIDFSAEETYIGASAAVFLNTVIKSEINLHPDYLDEVFAWSGTMKLAGFKLSTMAADLLDLSR